VEISIITDHPVCPIGHLVLQATLSVKDGLDRDTALRAITINPARVLGARRPRRVARGRQARGPRGVVG
jgi:imidazolonepropionase-like amidohydrolase